MIIQLLPLRLSWVFCSSVNKGGRDKGKYYRGPSRSGAGDVNFNKGEQGVVARSWSSLELLEFQNVEISCFLLRVEVKGHISCWWMDLTCP